MTKILALYFSLAAAACAPARVGTSTYTPVPPDAAATCAGYCKSLGLSLGSIVIMADNVAILVQQGAAQQHQHSRDPAYTPRRAAR